MWFKVSEDEIYQNLMLQCSATMSIHIKPNYHVYLHLTGLRGFFGRLNWRIARYAATPSKQKKKLQPRKAKNRRAYPAKCNPSSSAELCAETSAVTDVLTTKESVITVSRNLTITIT